MSKFSPKMEAKSKIVGICSNRLCTPPCKLSFLRFYKEMKVFVTLLEQLFQWVVSLVTSSSNTEVDVGPGKTRTGCYESKNRGV